MQDKVHPNHIKSKSDHLSKCLLASAPMFQLNLSKNTKLKHQDQH